MSNIVLQGETWGRLETFFFLSLAFPAVTADIKAVGTNDEGLRGPVFLAVLLRKTHLGKDRCRLVFSHTVCVHLTLSCLCFFFCGSQQLCWGVMKRQVVLCVCSYLCFCVWIWLKWHWKVVTGASADYWLIPPNLFSGVAFSLHSHRIIAQIEVTGEVCGINHSVCLARCVQMHVWRGIFFFFFGLCAW